MQFEQLLSMTNNQRGIMAIAIVLLGLLILGFMFVRVIRRPFNEQKQLKAVGLELTPGKRLGMWFRKSDAERITRCAIRAKHGGIDVHIDQIETHLLARGNAEQVIDSLILAKRENDDLAWDTACAIDLAGHDPLDFVMQAILTGCNVFEYVEQQKASQAEKT